MSINFYNRLQQTTALLLVLLLLAGSVNAGIVMTGADGIVLTGADGIVLTGADGIVMTGADGIVMTGADGIVLTGADGIVTTGADGIVTTGADGIVMTGADGIVMTGADGIVLTGADGIVMTGADGTRYNADSVTITLPNGINTRGANNVCITDADGVTRQGTDGIVMTGADGIVMTGADSLSLNSADRVSAVGLDGQTFSVSPNGIVLTGADNIAITRPSGINVTGGNGIVMTGADGIVLTGADASQSSGLQSVDPELAATLNRMVDDSTVNAIIIYRHLPTDADLADLQRIGIVSGTRYRVLPMVMVTGTRDQIIAISHLPSVRSIYGNRSVQFNADPANGTTGVARAQNDADLTRNNAGLPLSGRGVTVAVLDTGVDGTHSDLSGRVVQNVKLADAMSGGAGFQYPANVENLSNTDQAYGHGTFVAGVIGGNGNRSGGAYTGVAPGARIVGLSAGDANLFFVLDGFDYLLDKGANLGVRVVNCSFSTETIYDANDPVNIATKMLTERGVNVVFSAGNTGPGLHTLNPYAAAPWVVSVGATDERGRPASFSSRGDFASMMFHPTLVAPGTNIISLRASGANATGTVGVGVNNDAQRIPAAYLPFYTNANGTSFSAPQVAGAIALMLEANPRLSPTQVRDILERTATPLPPYYTHEVGAGMLNVHAAVLEAAFPARRMGVFRATLNRGQVRFINDPVQQFSGAVQPGSNYETTVNLPDNALLASIGIGWGPFWTTNDLGLALYDANGMKQADVNTINLPGLTGRREHATLTMPTAGAWRVRVTNTLGAAALTSQNVTGVLETTHAEYGTLRDLNTVSQSSRDEFYQTLRTFVMMPLGHNFRPAFAVSRADLATALLLDGRVPQYLPAQPTYLDVRDAMTTLAVESAQHAPAGALFTDATTDYFRPDAGADRITAAIALVRAAGLRAEAESRSGAPLNFLDGMTIPADQRGYLSVALSHGLLVVNDTYLRPQTTLTRAELAHALVVLQTSATQ